MRKIFIIVFLILIFNLQSPQNANATNNSDKNIIIKNKIFSIELPQKFRDDYTVKKDKYGISIYHKSSKKAGFGGFAFGIKGYKYPSDYAGCPSGKKLGELKDKNNVLYDIVLTHPTDVQYDYTKSPEQIQVYTNLYDLGDIITIQGIKGSIYYERQGTNGENLYNEILTKHKTAIIENWNSEKLKKENMSCLYSKLHKNKIGYVYYDINTDGIDELLIGEISEGNKKGIIYDIYTMVNRKPQHVISAKTNDRYYICDVSFVRNEQLSSTNKHEVQIYSLIENSTILYPQVSFKYNSSKNIKTTYFISYSENQWENFSENEFNERKKVFEKYKRFNYIPLLNFK